jgi:hypothetical protein
MYMLFNIHIFYIPPTDCVCVFHNMHNVNRYFFPLALTGLSLQRSKIFPLRYELNYYILSRRNSVFISRVEAGSNTSTVALWAVWGDENGTQCLDINTETWPSRLGESRIWYSKMRLSVPRDSDRIITALARPSIHCKRQTHTLVTEDVTWGL